MIFNIVTNLANGAGLEQDYKLLRRMLEAAGHHVNGVQFDQLPNPLPMADINIFVEVITPAAFKCAARQWLIPNPEWFLEKWRPLLPKFERVLCKTHEAHRIFDAKVGERAQFLGFESRDLYDPTIPHKKTFLHCAGKSRTKNTAAVAEAWRKFSIPYPLTVVAFRPEIMELCRNIPNVKLIERMSEEELRVAMNENLFHIMPSKSEGFGHYIHEALGCGGIVLTTDAPPMNEFTGLPCELLIPHSKNELMREATSYLVDPAMIARRIQNITEFGGEPIISQAARDGFLIDREIFRHKWTNLMAIL